MQSDQAIILVVEDSDEDFHMIEHGLLNAGLNGQIIRLRDGEEAHRLLDESKIKPHLIMLDLNLPGESGYDLLKLFKAHPLHKTTPVVILSTSGTKRDVVICYEAGANSYHVKPLETPLFHALVQQIAGYWFRYAVIMGSVK